MRTKHLSGTNARSANSDNMCLAAGNVKLFFSRHRASSGDSSSWYNWLRDKTGKGFQIHFSVLAAVITCCTIVLGEMMLGAVEGEFYYELTPWGAFLN